jgi:hypothetical protein
MAFQPFSSNRKTTIATVFLIGIVLIAADVTWRPSWIEPVTTILLCCITAVYVFLTDEALQVTQEQFKLLQIQHDREDRVLLFVDLSCEPPHLRLHIFNLDCQACWSRKS